MGPVYIGEALFCILFTILLLRIMRDLPKRKPGMNRIPFFDEAKGLAIILIIAIHATSSSWMHDILWFALPLFIIASGYLLTVRHSQFDLKRYAKNILLRIIPIYLFFVIIMRLLTGGGLWPADIALDLLLGRTEGGNYYFIPLLLSLYIIFPFLLKIRRTFSRAWMMSIIVLCSFLFFILDHELQTPLWNSNQLSLLFFGRFLYFFVIGMLFADYDVRFRKEYVPLLLFSAAAMVLFSLWTGKIYFTYAYPVIAFLALLSCSSFRMPMLQEIGKYSFVIYLVHTRLMYGALLPWTGSLQPLIAFFIVLLTTLCLSYLISKAVMTAYRSALEWV